MAVVPKSIRGPAYRVTCQDECDVPLTTPNRMLAGNGFLEIGLQPDVEDGDEVIVYLADGSICVQDMDDPRIKGWNVTLKTCAVDPLISELLIGGTTLVDAAGMVKGGWFPGITATGKRNSKQFEVWARNGDKGACVMPGETPDKYARFTLPRTIAWTLDDGFEFTRNGHQMLSFKGYAESNPNWLPVLGLDPAVDENAPAADQVNQPPVGTVFDPDFNYNDVLAGRAHGALGWIGSNTLPTFAAAGQYAA